MLAQKVQQRNMGARPILRAWVNRRLFCNQTAFKKSRILFCRLRSTSGQSTKFFGWPYAKWSAWFDRRRKRKHWSVNFVYRSKPKQQLTSLRQAPTELLSASLVVWHTFLIHHLHHSAFFRTLTVNFLKSHINLFYPLSLTFSLNIFLNDLLIFFQDFLRRFELILPESFSTYTSDLSTFTSDIADTNEFKKHVHLN